MTESEALSELRSFPISCLDFKEQMALDMAIEAMEKQEVAKEYEGKKYYRIVLSCLEDSTSLEMPLTKQEYLLLTRISDLVYRVATGCMPTMYVEQKGGK
jgi:hypothetical protein